jgi:AraC-like DNA-binding protein
MLAMARTVKDGWFHFVDELKIDGRGSSPFVIGRAWMIEFVNLSSGSLAFIADGQEFVPTAREFGIYYAPFSIVNVSIDRPRGRVEGFGSIDVSADLPGEPALFEQDGIDLTDLGALMTAAKSGTPIPQNSRPSLVSLRGKRIIDDAFAEDLAIAQVAAKVGVSHEHLTRQFRKDFELSPIEYLHRLRMAEATAKLSRGDEIIDVSSEVGYNDLSRFYKQFRRAFSATPGSCK